MGILDKIRGRDDDQEHHDEVDRKLAASARKARQFERRLKRVEVELDIVRRDVRGAV